MSTTHQSNVLRRKVLVTGASGLLSVAAMEKFVAAAWEAGRLPSGRDVDFSVGRFTGRREAHKQ